MEYLIYFLISLAIAIILKPKLESQQPPSADELKFPTIDPQRNIPVCFGQVRVNAVSFIWAGQNVFFQKLTKKVDGGLFGGSEKVTIGYQTFVSTAVAIGFGECFLKRIYFNDEVGLEIADPFTGGQTGAKNVLAEELFLNENDEAKKNGVSGQINFYDGTQTLQDPHIINQEGLDALPAFKGLSYAVFREFYWGNSRTLATPDFEIIRIPKLIDGVGGLIDNGDGTYDANPINILYEIMTEKEQYGLGIPDSKIDIDNFKEIAQLLEDEEFGLSLIFESGSNFEDIKKDIEKHCAINVFLSPYTGKWTITANRNDYIVENLQSFNKTNIKSVKYSRTQPNSLFSEMKVNFIDRNNEYKENSVVAKSLSIASIRGNPNAQKDTFNACKNQITAAKIAQREILGYNKPLAKLEILTNRDAYGLEIGDVIVVDYEDYNLTGAIFRVIEIDLGQFNKNEIKVNLIEDVFSFGDAAIFDLGGTKWTRPVPEDFPFVVYYEEAPIFYGNRNNILVSLTDHSNRSKGYELYLDQGTKLLQAANEITTPNSELTNAIGLKDTEIIIDSTGAGNFDLSRLASTTSQNRRNGDNYAIIYNPSDPTVTEIISFSGAINNGSTYTLLDVWRGCVDTTPKKWSNGSYILFTSYSSIVNNIDQTDTLGTSITFDVDRTFTDTGNVIALNDEVITFDRRSDKPFVPYSVNVNGEYLGEEIPLNTDLALTWSNSNKDDGILNLTYFLETTLSQEAGVTYNLELFTFDALGSEVFLRNETGLTGNSYTYVDEIADGGYYNKLGFRLYSERGGVQSHDFLEVTIDRVEKIVDIVFFQETTLLGNYNFVKATINGFDNILFASDAAGGIDIYRDTNGLQDISTLSLYDTIPTGGVYTPVIKACVDNDIFYLFYNSGTTVRCIVYDYFSKTFNDILVGNGQSIYFVHNNKFKGKVYCAIKPNLSSTITFYTIDTDGSLTVTSAGTTTNSITAINSRTPREEGDYCYYQGKYWFGQSSGSVLNIYSYDEDTLTESFESTYNKTYSTNYFPSLEVNDFGTCLVMGSRNANNGVNMEVEYFTGTSPTNMLSRIITISDNQTSFPTISLIDSGSCIFLADIGSSENVYFSSDFINFSFKGNLVGYQAPNFVKGGVSSFNILARDSNLDIINANYNAIY